MTILDMLLCIRAVLSVAWLCRYAAPVYCDIKHIVNVTDVDGSKLEDSVVKHDKIFLGEVSLVNACWQRLLNLWLN